MHPPALVLTPRLRLEPLHVGHTASLLAYHQRNADHLGPWEPRRSANFFEPTRFASTVASWVAACDAGVAARWVLVEANTPSTISTTCVGVVNASNIAPAPSQSCTLGYSLDAQCTGKGLMQEALRGVIAHLFSARGLHRIMANHMPHNRASANTLKALGFAVEGKALAYLQINGRWEDHVLTALVNPHSAPDLN